MDRPQSRNRGPYPGRRHSLNLLEPGFALTNEEDSGKKPKPGLREMKSLEYEIAAIISGLVARAISSQCFGHELIASSNTQSVRMSSVFNAHWRFLE